MGKATCFAKISSIADAFGIDLSDNRTRLDKSSEKYEQECKDIFKYAIDRKYSIEENIMNII